MEYLQIAVCEDNPEEQNQLLSLIENSPIPSDCYSYNSGEELLAAYQIGKFDLIIIDIYMDGINGIETVTKIREIDEVIPIAFSTSSPEHALESYRLNAIKYMEKPIKGKAVYELLEYALLKKKNHPRFHFKKNGDDYTIPFERILYFEQQSHQVTIYLNGNESLQITNKLEQIEDQFIGQSFFRCHKSFFVNLAYVSKLDKDLRVFTMKEGGNVHIRRESLGKAKKAYEEFLFKQTRGLLNG